MKEGSCVVAVGEKERERGQERCWCMSSQMEKERFGDSIVTSFLTPQVTAFSSRQVCVRLQSK